MKTDLIVLNLICLAGFYGSFYYLTPRLNELGSVIDLCQMIAYYLGIYNNVIINIRYALVGFLFSSFLCSFYAFLFSRVQVRDPSMTPFCFLLVFLIMCFDESNFYNGMIELNIVNDMMIRFSVVAVLASSILIFIFNWRNLGSSDRHLSLKILLISMLDLMIFFSFKDIGIAIVAGVIISLAIPKKISDKVWG